MEADWAPLSKGEDAQSTTDRPKEVVLEGQKDLTPLWMEGHEVQWILRTLNNKTSRELVFVDDPDDAVQDFARRNLDSAKSRLAGVMLSVKPSSSLFLVLG